VCVKETMGEPYLRTCVYVCVCVLSVCVCGYVCVCVEFGCDCVFGHDKIWVYSCPVTHTDTDTDIDTDTDKEIDRNTSTNTDT